MIMVDGRPLVPTIEEARWRLGEARRALEASNVTSDAEDAIEMSFDDLAGLLWFLDKVGERPKRRGRRLITDRHLETVRDVYRQALTQGLPPTQAVAQHFGTSHSSAARWVMACRREGLMEVTDRGRAAH